MTRSDDGILDQPLRMPGERGGAGGGIHPERLVAAGHAARFHGASELPEARAKVPIADVALLASATFGRDPIDGLFMLTTDNRLRRPAVDGAIAEEPLRNTERICPYVKLARNGIDCVVALDR